MIYRGGLAALVSAAHAHGAAEPKVREWVGAALANLAGSAFANDDIHEKMIDGGAPKAAVAMLRACDLTSEGEGGLRCARFCLGVWAHLARDKSDGSEACVACGFVEATVKVMLETPGSSAAAAEVMEEGCRAFATLAFADAEGKAALRDGGARRALTAACDKHPTQHKVQEMGRALLMEF